MYDEKEWTYEIIVDEVKIKAMIELWEYLPHHSHIHNCVTQFNEKS